MLIFLMEPKTVSYVEFDISELPVGASVGGVVGLDSQRAQTPLAFRGRVARELESLGQPYSELHKSSIILGDGIALWNAYQLYRLGKFKPTEEQQAFFDYLFERDSRIVCDNAVDYNDHGDLKSREDFSRVAVITQPDGFDFNKDSGLWKPILGSNSKVEHLYLPQSCLLYTSPSPRD